MPIKDKIVTWWIQNIIIPKQEIIDKPGFVVTTFTDASQDTYLRELFFAEHLIECIENKIVQNFGNQGRQSLYSIGKKFGYLYSSMSNFPTITKDSTKVMTDFIYAFVRYCEGVYAQQATHDINLEEKIFTISFDDYIICRHNGLGYIMAEGGSAGIWAYLMQDKSIEGIQLKCQGRGDQQCKVFCAPKQKLQETANTFFQEEQLFEQKFDEVYKSLNEIRGSTYAKNSLRDLIDIGFFDFQRGILSYKNNRFMGSESHMFYLIEQEIIKLAGGEQILFDACVEHGKLLQTIYGFTDYQKFIMDFFPALGFGDILVSGSKEDIEISSNYYPWTAYSEESRFIIFRGIMSGFISNSIGTKVEFNHYDTDIKDFLTLTIRT